MFISRSCPNCGHHGMSVFYKLDNVPVHSVLLLKTREEALKYHKGDISLGFCSNCGFISNLAFDPNVHEYSSRYEGTQAFSSTFSTFHKNLAKHLIERYDLHEKNIIEIGCGQGEFLTILCRLGRNHGVGFDPAYIRRHNNSFETDDIIFINDFYSEKYAEYRGDFICCKMTLEHIQQTADFVNAIRRSIGNKSQTIVFFQVPNVARILRGLAFWDIYYEHCSYFSLGSLARLFRNCGFDVIDLWKDYYDQYLMIVASPGSGKEHSILPQENDMETLSQDISWFNENLPRKFEEWQKRLNGIKENKKRAVIWGAGSKGVAFLVTLKIQDEIRYAVDINPHKHETYMAGTGHQIVGPDFLQEFQPDIVIVMNPVYSTEIQQELKRLNLSAELISV